MLRMSEISDNGNRPVAMMEHEHQWPGWERITTIFSFGDSYTTTGFTAAQGPQPDAAHPLGTPPQRLQTSSNGPNWICFLTTDYNEGPVKTYNLACGGATVASRLIHRFHPEVLSLEQQVQDVFVPLYAALCTGQTGVGVARGTSGVPASGAPTLEDQWRPSSTLFAFFVGINDVGLLYPDEDLSVYDAYLATYADLLLQVRHAGARNFLLLTVPPVDRSPLTTCQGTDASAKERVHIKKWNDGVAHLATTLQQKPGTAVFVFDTHAPFSRVMDDPAAFPETAVYRNTTDFCAAYAGGTEKPDVCYPDCPLAANQYMWLNDLHPTYPVHRLWARLIAEHLRAGPSPT
ncbi:hypothetical protein Sste5346_004970 [Sporothrix stenoceras]|uniref:Carbohydrate esterase family 16 protein n=1 Tax=Sporothrix stenoceras TaxID=5173 RepID=A0ABR3Z7S8_9PEZI